MGRRSGWEGVPPGPDPSPRCCSGVVLKGVGQTGFSSQIRTVTFKDIPASYKPGIPFQGKVAVRPASRLCWAGQNSELLLSGR